MVGIYLPLLTHILEDLSRQYAVTFIDTPSGIPLEELELYTIATHQIIVLELERVPKNEIGVYIYNELEKYLNLDMDGRMEHGVILNKVDKLSQKYIIDYIEENLEIPVLGVIPLDGAVVESISLKSPFLFEFPHSDASIALKDCGKVLEKWLFE
ncbi:hypothetical protein PAP_06845 [Palaeococcus pacificus DY20341]|uniref:CobQ/CobB/MinD/ParA nucleotide binding domain-containing protein n=1 Tax=Palaeococcus pacificus DY20341 TaxID=1343739 RepID=A0A075LTR8_9EURY|nr:hypothetical protein PAP_06845 [Palaeococcus pacificus DY20341]